MSRMEIKGYLGGMIVNKKIYERGIDGEYTVLISDVTRYFWKWYKTNYKREDDQG